MSATGELPLLALRAPIDAHGHSSASDLPLTGSDFDRTVQEYKTRERPYIVTAYKSGNVAYATSFFTVPKVVVSPDRGRFTRTFTFKVGNTVLSFVADVDLSPFADFWRTGTEENRKAAMRSTIDIRGKIASAGLAKLQSYNIASVAFDAGTARSIALQYENVVPIAESLVLNTGQGWVVEEAQRNFPIIGRMLAYGMVDSALRACGHTIYEYAPYPYPAGQEAPPLPPDVSV